MYEIYQMLVSVSTANKDPVYYDSPKLLIIVGEFVQLMINILRI